MKKLYLPVLLLLMLCLNSCVEIEEHYDFKADGSSNVVYGFDMSRAVAVLMNLMPDSLRDSPQFNMSKDTSMNFYAALPDSTQRKLNSEEAKMAQGSKLAVKMDLKHNVMKVSINHLAKNPSDLQYYLEHISQISMGSSQLNNISKNKTPNFNTQLTATGDYYNYEVSSHKFYRIVDKNKFNAFLKKTGSVFATAKAMLIDMPYKVVLNFAKPVKKVNNPKAIISPDKKQVTLKADMAEVIKDPTIMNLKVDF
jgi:hypothetical protein